MNRVWSGTIFYGNFRAGPGRTKRARADLWCAPSIARQEKWKPMRYMRHGRRTFSSDSPVVYYSHFVCITLQWLGSHMVKRAVEISVKKQNENKPEVAIITPLFVIYIHV